MSGAFLENYAIIEILKGYRNIGREPSLFYYRDTDGREIDLIIEEAGMLYPIEIKKQVLHELLWSKVLTFCQRRLEEKEHFLVL